MLTVHHWHMFVIACLIAAGCKETSIRGHNPVETPPTKECQGASCNNNEQEEPEVQQRRDSRSSTATDSGDDLSDAIGKIFDKIGNIGDGRVRTNETENQPGSAPGPFSSPRDDSNEPDPEEEVQVVLERQESSPTQPEPDSTTSQDTSVPVATTPACSNPANQVVYFSGKPAEIFGSQGHIDIQLGMLQGHLLPKSPHTVFSGSQPQYYQGGKIRNGEYEGGTFVLAGEEGNMTLVVKLDRGGSIKVGRVIDDGVGTGYPRPARVQLDFGACLVRYSMQDGSGLVSGGNGYILMP